MTRFAGLGHATDVRVKLQSTGQTKEGGGPPSAAGNFGPNSIPSSIPHNSKLNLSLALNTTLVITYIHRSADGSNSQTCNH